MKESPIKKFENFLKGFNKKPGEYTEEELVEIGTKYKTLPKADKRWDRLVKQLGVNKTGECFRIWLKDRQYANGTITKNEHMLSGQTINDLTYPEFEQKVEEQKRELYKQETRTRDERNNYRLLLRKDARLDRIEEIIKEGVLALKDFKVIKNVQNNNTNVEAVMLISDLHVGMTIDNFYNKYNVEIASKRLMAYVDETIKLCKAHKVQRLNVCNLGDLIHGIINVTGRIEANEDVITQIMVAAELLSNALIALQKAAPEVIYRSVTDNHSRAVISFKENVECENFSRLIDFYLKERLRDSNVKFANDNLDYDISMFTLLNGKKVVVSHGHRDNVNTILQGYVGATKQFIDRIFIGHFHESKMKSFQGAKVYVNGSICGSDTYAQGKRLYGKPEQTLVIYSGITEAVHYINLDLK